MKLKILSILVFFLTLIAIFLWFKIQNKQKLINRTPIDGIKYLPLGDSYTIGLGVAEKNRWPDLLTNHLKNKSIDIVLIANPAVSGYTVNDAISFQLPLVEKLKPDLITVLIGANDNFQGKNSIVFQQEFNNLLDKLQSVLTNPQNIILITLPDHTSTPGFASFQNKTKASKLIITYNEIIKKEARNRGLPVADIFPVSQKMTDYKDYIFDGLHPSAQGYQKWEKIIFPVVFKKIQEAFL